MRPKSTLTYSGLWREVEIHSSGWKILVPAKKIYMAKTNADTWTSNDDYLNGLTIVNNLPVINDVAERAVKLTQVFNPLSTPKEAQAKVPTARRQYKNRKLHTEICGTLQKKCQKTTRFACFYPAGVISPVVAEKDK
ncbi:hypothetical protein NQ318_003918 [Aromia moschata]|uniref:Uncharacterized protein n=1 Tax=Aromia moschata TaxID=1265417 RepID=A0AAV8Z7S8_9CUCU|nr:hypothetical protein NQ318_003918 [Aromia moschata]